MFEKLFRDCAIIAGGCVIAVTALNNPDVVRSFLGQNTNSQQTSPEAEPSKENSIKTFHAKTPPPPQSASVVFIPKSEDGHFWTEAQVNHGYVNFLVDTGASVIALTPEDASIAGIKLQDLKYNRTVSTAGGEIPAAYVTLDNVAVGRIELRNIQAIVIKDGLAHSLLGMSYLGELQKVEATPDSLILRL